MSSSSQKSTAGTFCRFVDGYTLVSDSTVFEVHEIDIDVYPSKKYCVDVRWCSPKGMVHPGGPRGSVYFLSFEKMKEFLVRPATTFSTTLRISPAITKADLTVLSNIDKSQKTQPLIDLSSSILKMLSESELDTATARSGTQALPRITDLFM